MKYYLLQPEVAGEIGDGSKFVYEDGKIKEVLFLEYNFMGWQGDELLTTTPCFIVTECLQKDILSNGLTGVTLKNIAMTFSDEFYEICGELEVPKFVQLICKDFYERNAEHLQNDFYLNQYDDMIVSEKALGVLKQHKLDMCDVEEYS